MLDAKAQSKSIEISIKEDRRAIFYGQKIASVLPYLIFDNAIKYSQKDSKVAISISVGENLINVSISNYGPPMDSQEIKHVFRYSVRGSAAKANGEEGSGIGLATCRFLVEKLLGGVIHFAQEGDLKSFSEGKYLLTIVDIQLPVFGRRL